MEYDIFVAERIAQLRQAKGVSARDMSLSIGQNVNYINHIENRKMDPSLSGFIYICDYFGITPQDFFDEGNPYPTQLKALIENMKRLDRSALVHLSNFLDEIVNKK